MQFDGVFEFYIIYIFYLYVTIYNKPNNHFSYLVYSAKFNSVPIVGVELAKTTLNSFFLVYR